MTGPISPDQRPTPSVPPNENCAAGYHYLQASAKCVTSSYGAQSWQVSRDYCIQNGGELASINSPEDQQEIYTIFALSDASAEGKLNLSFNSDKTETGFFVLKTFIMNFICCVFQDIFKLKMPKQRWNILKTIF